MKITKTLSAALISLFCMNFAGLACPNTTLGETDLDCPWADVARALEKAKGKSAKKALFQKDLKKLFKDIQSEASRKEIQALWGQSLNYDEFAKAVILDSEVLDLIFETARAPKREDRVVHAGLEHTYGYLLSTLQTPYGYKRARWVREDIENGFGLPRGTLGPNPKKGTLFLNVSYFASKMVRGEEKAFSKLKKQLPDELLKFQSGILKKRVLHEEVLFDEGRRNVHLVTEIFEFSKKPQDPKANSHLLIYWVKDSVVGAPKLITVFPVTDDFVTKVFDEKNLGENQPITTRYNAFISGLTGVATPFKGTRKELKYE